MNGQISLTHTHTHTNILQFFTSLYVLKSSQNILLSGPYFKNVLEVVKAAR